MFFTVQSVPLAAMMETGNGNTAQLEMEKLEIQQLEMEILEIQQLEMEMEKWKNWKYSNWKCFKSLVLCLIHGVKY